MYGQVVKLEEGNPYTSLSDARYTVAGILSSMANGIANTSNGDHTRGGNANNTVTTVEYTMPGVSYGTGVTTVTTPTLTPTTLANIEQSFVELTTVPMTTQPQPVQNQAGFVPPVVSRFRNGERAIPYWPTNSIKMISSGSELPVQPEQQKRKGGRRAKQESCNPEEAERRRIRRERNKLAAAKCRKRRLDHTNTLLMETEHLEEEKHEIENEIAKLQSQKEQLEFILHSHLPSCKNRGSMRLSTPTCPEFKMDGLVRSRPTSLSLSTTSSNGMVTPANVFTTPCGGTLYNFATSNMDDEHTGLTPVIHPSTCSGEACKTSGSSDLSSPEAIRSPTLVSL